MIQKRVPKIIARYAIVVGAVLIVGVIYAYSFSVSVQKTAVPIPGSLGALQPLCWTIDKGEFLGLLRAITTHGDLTDVAFIEKVLKTKFRTVYGGPLRSNQYDFRNNQYNLDYLTYEPGLVNVTVGSVYGGHLVGMNDKFPLYIGEGEISFSGNGWGLLFRGCEPLNKHEFNQIFAEGFAEGSSPTNNIYRAACKLLPGIDGHPPIGVLYNLTKENPDNIEDVTLSQSVSFNNTSFCMGSKP
jgi:hypothetical protein